MKPVAITAVVVALFAAGVAGGFLFLSQSGGQGSASPNAPSGASTMPVSDGTSQHGKSVKIPEGAAICAEHHVPEVICPFCKPSLIEDRGHCGTHNVPEALCTACSPILISAFKAEGDWCAEHGLPESQCELCGGGEIAVDSATPGAAVCATHKIPESECPFCDPDLIEKLGHCGGHDVPEALCSRCNPTLIAAFKAEGDWCTQHDLPESQCLICNPKTDG